MKKLYICLIALIGDMLKCFALNQRNFDATGSGSKGAPKMATYETSDETATVEGAGYFNGLSSLLRTGDLIYVSSTGTATATVAGKIYRVTVSGTTVTLATSVSLT